MLSSHSLSRALAKKAFTSYLRSIQMGVSKEVVNISSLPTDEYAASMGLAFTPDLPIIIKKSSGNDADDAEAAREENRKKKNINRSLDRLKKQIKEQKALKRAMKEAKNEEMEQKEKEEAEVNSDSDSDSDSHSSSDEGGLFTVKKVHKWSEEKDEEDDENDITVYPEVDAATLKKRKERKEKIKIRADGTARGGERSGKKISTFNDDGEMIEDPLRNMVEELSNSHATKRNKKAPAEQLAEIEEHGKRVKQRVDEGRQEDTQREKERIKTKHLEERKYGKRARDDEYDMAMEAPSLSNYDEKGSNDDDSSNDNNNSIHACTHTYTY